MKTAMKPAPKDLNWRLMNGHRVRYGTGPGPPRRVPNSKEKPKDQPFPALIAWMRENFHAVRGMKVENARKLADTALGCTVTTDQIGAAFIVVDREWQARMQEECA